MKDKIIVFLLKVLLGIVFIAFAILFIGACVGNLLNVDESPAPGLHWKL